MDEVYEFYTDHFMAIGERLKEARLRANLRQADVASVVGVSQAWVSRTERGVTRPTLFQIQDLAFLYGVSMDDLLPTREERVEMDRSGAERVEGEREYERQVAEWERNQAEYLREEEQARQQKSS